MIYLVLVEFNSLSTQDHPRRPRKKKQPENMADKQAPAFDFGLEDQQVVLFNLAHRRQAIVSPKPAIRFLAILSADDLEDQADLDRIKERLGVTGPVFSMPLRQMFLICKSPEMQASMQYNGTKLTSLTKLHGAAKEAGKSDFDTNHAERKTGKTGASISAQLRKADVKRKSARHTKALNRKFKSDKATRTMSAAIPSALNVPEHQFAVITVMRDLSPQVLKGKADPEPLVVFLGGFANEPAADLYIKDVLQIADDQLDYDVVAMQQWLFPEHVDEEKIDEVYADKELDVIMRRRKVEIAKAQKYSSFEQAHPGQQHPDKEEVQSFEEWQAQIGVTADNANDANDRNNVHGLPRVEEPEVSNE
jgi:hypothetical protein